MRAIDAGRFELPGVVLRSPVTAGSNLMLAVMCLGMHARFNAAADERTRMWGRFFLALALAALAGVPKHALSEYGSSPWLRWIVLVSSFAGGASTYYAQRATIASGVFGVRSRTVLLPLVRLQLAAFALLLALKQEFSVVILQTGLGLAGVLVSEWAACRRGRSGNWWIVSGLAASFLPGFAYLLGWPAHPWFGHNDLAHVLMGISIGLVYRGTRPGGR